jgi:hypothetical protein
MILNATILFEMLALPLFLKSVAHFIFNCFGLLLTFLTDLVN